MEILTGITPYVVVVLALALLAVALVAGTAAAFVVRHRARRVRSGAPVRAYYRELTLSH